jgi:hypothetical protein
MYALFFVSWTMLLLDDFFLSVLKVFKLQKRVGKFTTKSFWRPTPRQA